MRKCPELVCTSNCPSMSKLSDLRFGSFNKTLTRRHLLRIFMEWHKLHVSSCVFGYVFSFETVRFVTALPLCFQASKHCCNGWRPRPGSHESCRPPTPLVEAGTRKQVGKGLLIFADYLRLAIGHWDLKHSEFVECLMCFFVVCWKIMENQGQICYTCFKRAILFNYLQKIPRSVLNSYKIYISALTNHSFAAENVGETPTASVQNHVLGVQNLQIHVLVNGFQGALVLHSWRLACINSIGNFFQQPPIFQTESDSPWMLFNLMHNNGVARKKDPSLSSCNLRIPISASPVQVCLFSTPIDRLGRCGRSCFKLIAWLLPRKNMTHTNMRFTNHIKTYYKHI